MTHCTCTTVAGSSVWRTGRMTFTAVASMNAMLEASTAATSTQRRGSGLRRSARGDMPGAGNAARVAGELPADERDRDQARGVDVVDEVAQLEPLAKLALARGDQLVDLELADHVARAVRRLLQIQVLLEPDRLPIEAEPAARSLGRREAGGLFDPELVRVHAQVADRARRPLRKEDMDELARSRPGVAQARVHHQLLHRGREPFGAAVE